MPKLSPKLMKEAIEEFKSKFTGGFYHGSPSNKIKAFDSTKNTDPMKLETPGVTFVTRDPDFAEAFMPMTEKGQYKTGATMYPVKVNLGKHWHPDTPEGQEVIKSYLTKMYPHEANPDDLIDLQKEMSMGRWTDIENPHFLQHLRDTGHDTFFVEEGGIPNVGVFEPHNIRGKFAEYNPEEAMNPDFMKAQGGAVEGYAPGGAIKKVLEFARKVPFVHFSHAENISQLQPSMYGTGIKGAEAARLKEAPDIRPRSYVYVGENIKPEQGLGPHKYTGMMENSYPLHEDPADFYSIAKQQAVDPFFAKQGIEVVDRNALTNALERQIKEAGYGGYHTDTAGVLFHPTDVVKSTD